MHSRRAITALAVAGLVAGTMSVADAQETVVKKQETFLGTATAKGAELSLFGNTATLGFTEVAADSGLLARATGAGQLNPIVEGSQVTAEVTKDGGVVDQPETCDAALPGIPGLTADLACSQASAKIVGGLPQGTSTASVGGIVVAGDDILDTIGLGDPISDGVTQVFDALAPLFDQFTGTPLDPVDDTLKDVIQDVLQTDTLSIAIGTSKSEVISTAEAITSTASAQGAVVEILPEAYLTGPLARIEVGAASATAVRNRAGDTAVPAFDPALVRVTLAPDALAGLGLPADQNVIEVAPGQRQCLPLPEPLTSCIEVAAGETFTLDDGTVGARSSAVSLELITGVEGGVVLRLAAADARVAGSPAEFEQITPPAPNPPVELPRTGGTATIPLLGAALLGLAWLARRLTARA